MLSTPVDARQRTHPPADTPKVPPRTLRVAISHPAEHPPKAEHPQAKHLPSQAPAKPSEGESPCRRERAPNPARGVRGAKPRRAGSGGRTPRKHNRSASPAHSAGKALPKRRRRDLNPREGITLNPLSRRAPSTGLGDASSDDPLGGHDDGQDYPLDPVGGKAGPDPPDRHSACRGRHLGRVARVTCTVAGIDGGRQLHVNQPGVVGVRSTVGCCARPTEGRHVVDQGTELCRGVLAQPDADPRHGPAGPGTARSGPGRPRRRSA